MSSAANISDVRTTQAEKFSAACAYLRRSIALSVEQTGIDMNSGEIGDVAYLTATQLSLATIEAISRHDMAALRDVEDAGHQMLRHVYAKILARSAPEYSHPPIFTAIAIEQHLLRADLDDTEWPSPNLASITKFAMADIGPITFEHDDGIITSSYFRGLRLHRSESEGPALTAIRRDGLLIDEQYWRNGMLHRADGPASTTYDQLDRSVEEKWFLFDRGTRNDGPAHIWRSADGRVLREMWYRGGILHRDDGPAYVERSADADTVWEIFASGGAEGPLLMNGVAVNDLRPPSPEVGHG